MELSPLATLYMETKIQCIYAWLIAVTLSYYVMEDFNCDWFVLRGKMTNEPNSFYFFWGVLGGVKESLKKKNSVIPFQLPKRCLLKTLRQIFISKWVCKYLNIYIYVFQWKISPPFFLCLKRTNIFKQHISVVEIICKLLVNKYKYK